MDIDPSLDLDNTPLAAPPHGKNSNFAARSELIGVLIPVFAILTFLQLLFTGLRIVTKFNRKKLWKMDDWFAIVAMVVTTAFGAILMPYFERFDRHIWDLPMRVRFSPWIQKMSVSTSTLMPASLLIGKVSMLMMYYRIFGNIDRVRYQLYGTAFLCSPLLGGVFLFPILQAPPPGHPWGTPNGKMILNTRTSLAIGAVNFVVDACIFVIPIPVVTRMNLSRKKKAGVLAVFLTGMIALVADIVIMYFRVQLYKATDPLRHGMIVYICSYVEACISVICSSMPSAAKFYRQCIRETAAFRSLRSKICPDNSNKATHFSLPTFMKRPEPVKKRRDPYSIGLSTITLSTKALNKDILELNDVSGYSITRPDITVYRYSNNTSRDGIKREISFEQSSSHAETS